MNIITDPFFYLLAIPVVVLLGMAKGGLGPGIGAIAVPALAFVISPIQAAAILLPILCFMDILAIARYRKSFSTPHLLLLVPAGSVGIALASLLLGKLPPDTLRILIGVTVVWFCLDHWLRKDTGTSSLQGNKSKLMGFFWGALSGFTSTQIHAGGPPISIYLLPQKLDKVVLIATMAVFFACINFLKLIPYTYLGLLNGDNLLTSLVLMPLAPIGVKLGAMFLGKVRQEIIYRILYTAMFVSGIKLLSDGIF